MFDAADLAAFVDPGMPGYALASVGGTNVDVLFHAPYAGPLGVESSNPTARCILSALPANYRTLPVVIGGVTYSIVGVQPNGRGLAVLELREA
jgi:hypothetical protein